MSSCQSEEEDAVAANHHYATISEVSALVRQQRVWPVDVVEECLERIERLNPVLNAFITVTADPARAEARRAEPEIRHGHWRGALHGIPVAVKDFFDTAGVRTTAAFGPFCAARAGKRRRRGRSIQEGRRRHRRQDEHA
jgi:aspartyl-tRNA(Asn)/glutamyl-tRNA(Gln) amidotransferase subunit A